MRRLTGAPLRRFPRGLGDDRGGVAILVAVTFVVLLGMAALVLDVGNAMWERRMLQNSADAAALSAAQDYARGDDDLAEPGARELAQDNNVRGAYVEGFAPDLEASRVRVDTTTGDLGGPGTLPTWFASVIGTDEVFAGATATARWGRVMSVEGGFPLAICDAYWDDNRPVSSNTPGPLVEIRYKGTGGDPPENECLDETGEAFNPGTNPGNFSWLDPTGEQCETDFDFTNGTVEAGGDPGVSVPSGCSDDIAQMAAEIAAGDLPVRVVPVYRTVTGTGRNATYELVTLAAFEFSGLKTSGNQSVVAGDWQSSQCRGGGANHLCIQGRFTTEVALGEIDDTADSDVLAVELIE